MAMEIGTETTLDLRLPSSVREAVEQAAAHMGQSVDEFAVSALAHTAREVIEHRGVTVLSARDRERFLALLDEPAVPNTALKAAAQRYKQECLSTRISGPRSGSAASQSQASFGSTSGPRTALVACSGMPGLSGIRDRIPVPTTSTTRQ